MRKSLFFLLVLTKVNVLLAQPFYSGFSTYTPDGLFSLNAQPTRFLTPGGAETRVGYLDYGSGQYVPRIGFLQNSTYLTPAQNSLGNVGDGSFTINVGENNTERLRILPSGYVGIGTGTPSYNFVMEGSRADNWNGVFTGPNGQAVYMAHGGGYGMHINGGSNASASTYLFEAYSQGYPRFYIRGDGNVGVGTNNPVYSFVTTGNRATDWNALFTAPNGQAVYLAHGNGYGMHVNAGPNANASTYIFEAYSNGLPRFYIQGDGNVGIGTTTPQEKLSVNGKIRAKEIKVETVNWPDYVFSPSYKLPDLKATEQFIKKNGHLPEIPSAVEVEKEGVSLGEMNAKLLKKIEELTLYLIEQNQKIKQQEQYFEKKIASQQEEINRFKSICTDNK
jgi:hypothetical protein